MDLSKFGEKLCARTGILELMDDLGVAMSGEQSFCMLGGGNPAAIPEVQSIWRERMAELLADEQQFDAVLANYDTPKGSPHFMRSLANFLNRNYGWDIGEKNIAITNGSQSAFFYLFNMLAGEFSDGRHKRILFPLCPEYIGYADQGLGADLFTAARPVIDVTGPHSFKYRVDFENLEITEDIAALCISRPTNPSANVISDEEIERLHALAVKNNIPLIIDNAYGAPFPGIVFEEIVPTYGDGIILSLSLSKLGLPGTRTGIIVANEEVINAVSSINAIASLANGNVGQAIVAPLLDDDRILSISREQVRPFYQRKSEQAIGWLTEFLDDAIPYFIHESQGAMFLWLWFRDLPISSRELYGRLKSRGVIVVSGHYFFFGQDGEELRHRDECIRINHSQPDETVRKGLQIIAEEVAACYST